MKKQISNTFFLASVILIGLISEAQTNNAAWNTGTPTPQATIRGRKVARGYIVPRIVPIPGGAELTVEIYQDRKNSPVSLYLQASINTGNNSETIPLKILSNNVNDNHKSYYSERKFNLTYAQLNQILGRLAPNAGQLHIGPGTPLFVYARFSQGHQWGGPERGGLFYMPTDRAQATIATSKKRTTELDLAFPINTTLANVFNVSNSKVGLKVDGQIRSRVEGEGKFQVLTEAEFNVALEKMMGLAKDPAQAKKVLGTGWKLTLEDRYMKKQANGNLELNSAGLPIPDPMIDTYYDNKTYDAAKNDMAIRYRWTKGNNTGAWNYKPGMGITDKEGLVYRTEYAVETTDNKPKSIETYADSLHPLNIFKSIRTITKGALPSTFFEPSVEINDTRYKFKLEHKNGLIIEISLDNVTTKSLRSPGVKPIRFFQLEMDIDHLATKSTNVAGVSRLTGMRNTELDPKLKLFLKKLGNNAFFNGVPDMHVIEDLSPRSPLRIAHDAEFKLAQKAIVNLRNAVVGDKWYSGSQKYAVAAHALGLVDKTEASTSVKKLLGEIEKIRTVYAPNAKLCKQLFGK